MTDNQKKPEATDVPTEKTQSFDLVIVGGGMVGATLALALADSSLSVAVVDQQSLKPSLVDSEAGYAPRVSALTEASTQLFQKLNCWKLMEQQRVCPYQHMYVWDGEGTGDIAFDATSVGYSYLGHIVENEVIRQALLTRLNETSIELFQTSGEAAYQLDSESHRLTLADGRVLEARMLVAADGAESKLRKLSGIPSSQKDYLHHAVVTTVETEKPHQDTAWQNFLETGPLAFLPLPDRDGKHYCSVVWSLVPEEAERIMAMEDEIFCQAIEQAFESRLGKVLTADPRYCFPLRQRHARQYHRNRVVLVGDAAHTIHPLAGQGVNLGLQDAEVLAEELLRSVERGDDFAAEHILNRYERRRRGSNLTMMKAMEGLQNLFAANDLGIRWLRNTGLKLTNQMPWAKELLIRQAMGLH